MKNPFPIKPQSYWKFARFRQFRLYSLLIGAFVYLIGYIIHPTLLRTVVMAAGILCILSELPVFLLFWRCPHCHELRPWHYSKKQTHCTACGKEIEDP